MNMITLLKKLLKSNKILKKNYIITYLITFSLSTSVYSEVVLKVEIHQTNSVISYETPPRLSQLLQDSYKLLDYRPYTLGSALINKDKTLEIEKGALLATLKTKNENELINLYSIIKKIDFRYKENLTLDLEKIQLSHNLNPKLKGSYELHLPKRPKYIFIIDPIRSRKIIKTKVQAGYDLTKYLKNYHQKANNKSILNVKTTIIQADKTITNKESSYWNNKKYYLSPGSIIYFDINKNIEKASEINASLISLLQHQVDF